MRPLNDIERIFAEKHHNLVASFLRRKGYDEHEYYDVAIFGYLQAVVNYHDRPQLQQYAFSTIAHNAMWSSCGAHDRKRNARKRCAIIVSLDAPIAETNECTLHEVVADRDDSYDIVYFQDTIDRIRQIVPRRQADVLQLNAAGYDNTDIARFQGISPGNARHMLWLARKRLNTSLVK